MTSTFKQTYSKVMEELKNEKHEYYLFLKRNNHLNWCKGKIRKRFVIFIRRNYTMPLYHKQKKEYELQLKKDKEDRKTPNDFRREIKIILESKYNIQVDIKKYKSMNLKYQHSTKTLSVDEKYLDSQKDEDYKEIHKSLKIWLDKHKKKEEANKDFDRKKYNEEIQSLLNSKFIDFKLSSKMTTTLYSIKQNRIGNKIELLTINKNWFEKTSCEEDLQKFLKKIKSRYIFK